MTFVTRRSSCAARLTKENLQRLGLPRLRRAGSSPAGVRHAHELLDFIGEEIFKADAELVEALMAERMALWSMATMRLSLVISSNE